MAWKKLLFNFLQRVIACRGKKPTLFLNQTFWKRVYESIFYKSLYFVDEMIGIPFPPKLSLKPKNTVLKSFFSTRRILWPENFPNTFLPN